MSNTTRVLVTMLLALYTDATIADADNITTTQSGTVPDVWTAQPEVQLVGESDNETTVGFVQVLRGGQWHNVCSHGWGDHDAMTVCRELGYDRGVPYHVRAIELRETSVPGRAWPVQVQCRGTEARLADCPTVRLSTPCVPAPASCDRATPGIPDGTLRLSGGELPYCGQVQVMYRGLWGAVCDRYWDDTSAGVVCGLLGYAEGGTGVTDSLLGVGFAVFLDAVRCQGGETVITQCTDRGYLDQSCRVSRTAGVVCHQQQYSNLTGHVRLAGSDSPHKGFVEVSYYGVWGAICDPEWDNSDASVLCRQLGYAAGRASEDNTFKAALGPAWLNEVICQGNESALEDCTLSPWEHYGCGYNVHVPARVQCVTLEEWELSERLDDKTTIYIVSSTTGCLFVLGLLGAVVFCTLKTKIRRIPVKEPQPLAGKLSDTRNPVYRATSRYTSHGGLNHTYDGALDTDPRHRSGDYTYIMDDQNVYLDLLDDLEQAPPDAADRQLNLSSSRAHTPLPDLPSEASDSAKDHALTDHPEYLDASDGYLRPVDWTKGLDRRNHLENLGCSFVVSDSSAIPQYTNVPEVRVIGNRSAVSGEKRPARRMSSVEAYVTAIQLAAPHNKT